MKYKLSRGLWIVCDVILMVLIFFSSGVIGFSEEDGEFCVWGFSCGDGGFGNTTMIPVDAPLNYSGYEANEEGVVSRSASLNDTARAFFQVIDAVESVSVRDYNDTINHISNEGSFDELYDEYVKIFRNSYSSKLDNHLGGEYVQNVGELISNDYRGDCDDYALWLYIIAKEKGLDVRYVIGYSDDGGHAWIQINVDGGWIDYNSTNNEKGKDAVSRRYYKRFYSDEVEDIV